MRGDARFLAVETLIFGRPAMGEDVRHGACRDAWRVRRDGGFGVRRRAPRSGAPIAGRWTGRPRSTAPRAAAMLIYAAPPTRQPHRNCARHAGSAGKRRRAQHGTALLVVRAAAVDGRSLQGDIAPLIEALSGRPLPRVWQC